MSNPTHHTCSTCGYTWRHGLDGSHSCTIYLTREIELLKEQLAVDREKLVRYEKEEMHRIIRMLVEDHLLISWGKDPRHSEELKKFWLNG